MLCMALSPPVLFTGANLGFSCSFSPLHAPDHNGDEYVGYQVCVRAGQGLAEWSWNQMREPGLRRSLATSMNADELEIKEESL